MNSARSLDGHWLPCQESDRSADYRSAPTTLQEQVDALKRLQAETASELDALLPPVISKAFAGEL